MNVSKKEGGNLFDIMSMLGSLFFMLRVSPKGSAFPKPLSREKEKEALEEMEKGSIEARNLLIEHNMRLVAHIVKKYYAGREDQDDLISIGTIGLIKGVSSFDVSKGKKLTTYVSRCIENEILMYFRAIKKQAGDVSLSEPIDGDDEGSLFLLDTISVPDTLAEDLDMSERQKKLYEYIAQNLDSREREIVIMRYGLFGTREYTQKEIAEIKGISRSYVSRIEKKALEKLKDRFLK